MGADEPSGRVQGGRGVAVTRVPVRIETQRLVLRRYEPTDLDALKAAVAVSLDGIRPWMPNAARELSGDLADWLDLAASRFDVGAGYAYGLFTRAGGTYVGQLGATPRDDGSMELGYWAHARYLRQGFVSEAVRALVRAGIGERYVIHCSPDNAASMGVARTCGFTQAGTRVREIEGAECTEVRWELGPQSS